MQKVKEMKQIGIESTLFIKMFQLSIGFLFLHSTLGLRSKSFVNSPTNDQQGVSLFFFKLNNFIVILLTTHKIIFLFILR